MLKLAIKIAIIYLAINSSNASDIESIMDKCISYGAQPGTSTFYSCMRELDQKNQSDEKYQQEVESCKRQRGHKLFSNPNPYDVGFSLAYADTWVDECIREAARIYKGTSNDRMICSKDFMGNTKCEK